MAISKVLVDSNFLHAIVDQSDKYHQKAITFAQTNTQPQIIPDVVLTEVSHSIKRLIGDHALVPFLRVIADSDAQLEPIIKSDILRAAQIMEKYPKAKFDFVDCCIMAQAERLNITQVCTFDRRDFSIFRPTHCEVLELLP